MSDGRPLPSNQFDDDRPAAGELIALFLRQTHAGAPEPRSVDPVTALIAYIREADAQGLQELARMLDVAVAALDRKIAALLNAILHHPRFQRLEATWRGAKYLVDQAADAQLWMEQDGRSTPLKICILHVTKDQLFRDVSGALEIDQSAIWQKVYEQEFGVAGGSPFGLLIGDYEFGVHPQDITLLECMGQVAAASFAPFVAGASVHLFEIDSFRVLERSLSFKHFSGTDFIPWRSLRNDPNMRFVGLTLPRIILRNPYDQRHGTRTGVYFDEDLQGTGQYLWGNAAFAFGAIVVRAFAECGWFAEIRGVTPGVESGGLVTGLPRISCATDEDGVALRSPVEVMISDEQESLLASHGFIPLCGEPNSRWGVFHANPSLFLPEKSTDADKTENERLSSMLQYVLCTSRFAHHVKCMGRTWLGSATSSYELTTRLDKWLMQYVLPTDNAEARFKARHPLRAGEVEIVEELDNPGVFRLIIRLQPHYQLDGAIVRLETKIIASDIR